MEERLSWNEIVQLYPNQWVRLSDVEWEPDNAATVRSAVVEQVGNPTEQDWIDVGLGRSVVEYTTPNRVPTMGALMI